MRAGRMNKGLVKDDNGKVLGISLGADFCAEHEWGITGLRQAFGMDNTKMGVAARTTTVFDEDQFIFIDDKDYVLLMFSAYGRIDGRRREALGVPDDEDGFSSGWSENTFGVLAKAGTEAADYVKRLYKAFQEKDVMIMVGAPKLKAFDNGGLLLSIASKLPQEVHDIMEQGDKDIIALEEADEATGIKKLLKEKGKEYFALSPRWLKDMRGDWPETKHPVVYWLNPRHQRIDNYGYFTVEQLELWAEGKGPIPKKKEKV